MQWQITASSDLRELLPVRHQLVKDGVHDLPHPPAAGGVDLDAEPREEPGSRIGLASARGQRQKTDEQSNNWPLDRAKIYIPHFRWSGKSLRYPTVTIPLASNIEISLLPSHL